VITPKTSIAILVLVASWITSSCARTQELPTITANNSDFVMEGANGGRGGLPQVNIWWEKAQLSLLKRGEHSWSYPDNKRPKDMNYSSWSFWRFGISDALLQLIFEEATDPKGRSPKLGPYFLQLENSNQTCWSPSPSVPAGLHLDVSDDVAITESFRSDHYITYGITNQLFFNGNARYLLTVDPGRHIKVKLLSSTMPPAATQNLTTALERLDKHPVLSFPKNEQGDHIQLIAEFIIERAPGLLRKGKV
jgi:hypothetical protein